MKPRTMSVHSARLPGPMTLALTLLMAGQSGLAQTPDATAPTPAVSSVSSVPFGECALGSWSSNRNLDDRTRITNAGCVLSWKPKLGEHLRLGLNARAGWNDQGSANRWGQRLREAYLDFDAEPFSLRVGRQIIAWGRADRINPTDSLSPRDFTLLTPEDEQQRSGLDAAQLQYAINPAQSLTWVVAKSAPNRMPAGALPPNLALAVPTRATEWALKLNDNGGGLDWSVSYFDGLDRAARFWLDFTDPRAPVFRRDFQRLQKLGADFAIGKGAWTFRGEFAHTMARPGCAACPDYRHRTSAAVLGADVDFAQTMNANVQVFTTLKDHFGDAGAGVAPSEPGQTLLQGLNRLNTDYARRETGLTLRLSDRILNDKLRWEISVVLDHNGKSHAIRPRLTYAVNDDFRLNAGLDRFQGPSQSYFGALTKNTLAFASISWVF